MTGIPRTIMVEGKPFNTEHKLNEYNHVKPIKQNKRGLGPDRNMAACKETEELTKAGILWKVKHQTWVANPVMVKKSDGGWIMYVDFTDINKACPNDCYPLLEIDWKIESLSGFRLKYFLDAYKGYHQIQMAEEDKDKTAFYAGEGVFCYKKMPFGLKNAGATYQRLVDKVFSHQIGRNLEAYVDDMVIKSTSEKEMLKNIQETFKRFRSINMKLNLKKCPFDVEEVPFLGHLITKKGIKANPLKEVPNSNCKWRLYIDGASNSDGSGAGLTLIDPEGKEYTYALRFKFETKNNEAESEALLVVEHVRRNKNKKADALSKLALMTFKHLTKEVLVKVLTKRSIEEKEVLKVDMQERKSWMDPIHEYLLSRLLPEDTKKARKIRIQPSMHREVSKEIQDCKKCKEQSTIRKAGTSGAIAAGSTWPFIYWGIHILGIAVEHSTKFGVPQIISLKEEKHFKEGMFVDLCKGLKVTQSFSPITEHMEIMHHIERQLTRSQHGWVNNLAKTLWIHRTLPRNSQKEMPFSLTYGSEAVIPIIETTDDRGRVQKATNEKESKEVASIEKAYYRNKLQIYHIARSSHPMYIVGDFVLLK
ncbi:reverse transcriptase domain-containing protein [Tanacetum coccineum]